MGCQDIGWVRRTDRPLFISYSRLRARLRRADGTPKKRKRSMPRARGRTAVDSRGFVELLRHGRWRVPPLEYVLDVAAYNREVGNLDFWIPQDWMCEDFMLEKTGEHEPGGKWPDRGTAIREHQHRTVQSYLTLRALAEEHAPELVPLLAVVLQGYTEEEYLECLRMYEEAGVDVRAAPRIAVGSMCKRQNTDEAAVILRKLASMGLKVHALGYKTAGLPKICGDLETDPGAAWSADSFAWSDIARASWYIHPGCHHGMMEHRKRLGREEHGNCANCFTWALWWADDVEAAAWRRPRERVPGTYHARGRRGPRLDRRPLKKQLELCLA
jgi:hypothetical protein